MKKLIGSVSLFLVLAGGALLLSRGEEPTRAPADNSAAASSEAAPVEAVEDSALAALADLGSSTYRPNAEEPEEPVETGAAPVPSSGAPRRTEAQAWFDSQPTDTEWDSGMAEERQRQILSPAKLDLVDLECRVGVCRMTFTYGELASARAQAWGQSPSPGATAATWSYSEFNPAGRMQVTMFIARGGVLPTAV